MDSITAHVLSPVVQCQDQPSKSDFDAAREDAIHLSQSRAIAHAGCVTIGWQTPSARESQKYLLRNPFIYLPAPPPVPAAAAPVFSILKEWDTHPSESEKFSVANLRPFESTLFCSVYSQPPVGDPAAASKEGCSLSRRRSGSCSSSPSRPPTKRTRVEVDTGPLDELIPPPHYVPASLKSSHPPLPRTSLEAHGSFAPVSPQTMSSIEALFSSEYSRVAWLIPVRGLPPWDDVSRACVALGHLSIPVSGPSHPSTSSDLDIVWTHSSLGQFWTFLKSCSATPGSVMGPLSLSFCAALRPHSTGSQWGAVASLAAAYLPVNRETEMTPSDPSLPVPIASVSKSRLTYVDYIKVYCDAPRAMSVRRTLGQWAYRDDPDDGDAEAEAEDPSGLVHVETIRILERAKLVLVDERGEGVLVS